MALPPNSSLNQYRQHIVARQPGDGMAAPQPQAAGAAANGAAAAGAGGVTTRQMTTARRLQALLTEVDPRYVLEEGAAEDVLSLVEHFMHSVANKAAQAARHRGGAAIEHGDVGFALMKQWNMAVPGVVPPGGALAADGSSASVGGGGKKGVKRKATR